MVELNNHDSAAAGAPDVTTWHIIFRTTFIATTWLHTDTRSRRSRFTVLHRLLHCHKNISMAQQNCLLYVRETPKLRVAFTGQM